MSVGHWVYELFTFTTVEEDKDDKQIGPRHAFERIEHDYARSILYLMELHGVWYRKASSVWNGECWVSLDMVHWMLMLAASLSSTAVDLTCSYRVIAIYYCLAYGHFKYSQRSKFYWAKYLVLDTDHDLTFDVFLRGMTYLSQPSLIMINPTT